MARGARARGVVLAPSRTAALSPLVPQAPCRQRVPRGKTGADPRLGADGAPRWGLADAPDPPGADRSPLGVVLGDDVYARRRNVTWVAKRGGEPYFPPKSRWTARSKGHSAWRSLILRYRNLPQVFHEESLRPISSVIKPLTRGDTGGNQISPPRRVKPFSPASVAGR